MKSYDSTTETMPPVQSPTPLVVRAIGAGGGLFLVTVIVLGWIAERDMSIVLKIGAGLFCVPVLFLVAGDIASVVQATAEKITQRDLNRSGMVGDRPEMIRLIPVKSNQNIGVDAGMDMSDLKYMVSMLDHERQCGWTVREWMGQRLPSGREIISSTTGPYAEFISILERTGALVDRTERYKGQLTMSADEIMVLLGL